MYNIDCDLLMKAMQYYKSLGYKTLSAPILVDKDIIDLTLPHGRTAKEHLGKYYVGSAEQSFYQIMKDGLTLDGNYMMITPCERDDEINESHLNIFLKVELLSTWKSSSDILKDCSDFLSDSCIGNKIVKTLEGFDIEVNGIEVGSYGSRYFMGKNISYGTGLALPRISQAIKG